MENLAQSLVYFGSGSIFYVRWADAGADYESGQDGWEDGLGRKKCWYGRNLYNLEGYRYNSPNPCDYLFFLLAQERNFYERASNSKYSVKL